MGLQTQEKHQEKSLIVRASSEAHKASRKMTKDLHEGGPAKREGTGLTTEPLQGARQFLKFISAIKIVVNSYVKRARGYLGAYPWKWEPRNI